MGMYDYLKVEYPLPDGHDPAGEEYQTKDTPAQYLDLYRITREGALEHQNYDTENRSDPNAEGIMGLLGCMTRVNQRWEPEQFHGDLSFYRSDGQGKWREYVALFKDGKLIDLRGGAKQ